jgi:histidine triad (HIT) family protein
MNECIFCKIAKGEIPSEKVHHEDNSIISFLDMNQSVPGHTLVIPIEHYHWFDELPDELGDKLFRVAKKIAKELKGKYNADYVRLNIVGTDIPHVHIHLIPQKLTP